MIILMGKFDENWFEGILDGKFGWVFVKYVEILVDLL